MARIFGSTAAPVVNTKKMFRFDGPIVDLIAWHRAVVCAIGHGGFMDGDSYLLDVTEAESWKLAVTWKTGGFSECLKFQ